MVSHAAGARFVTLIGGSMLSFYDWYADLPVASPQVFGDQTDVPESGDWWDAGYLIMWGSNLPVTRTPDAHWMTEARYRGQKVVVCSPDYADNVEVRRRVAAAPQPGTDGALAMAMGHVVLKEFFVDRQMPYFTDYVKTLHRPAFLVRLEPERDGEYTAGKFLTAADLGAQRRARTPPSRPSCSTPHRAARRARTARSGIRYGDAGVGRWNLDLGDVDPLLSPARPGRREPVVVGLPRFDTPDGAAADDPPRRAGPAHRRAPGHHRLRPAARPVRRRAGDGPAGRVAARLRRRRARRTPRPGRRRSPASRPRPRPGSPASSPPTPRSPAAAR